METLINLYERLRTRLFRPAAPLGNAARRHTLMGANERTALETRPVLDTRAAADEQLAVLALLGTYGATQEAGAPGAGTGETQSDLVSEFERRYWGALEGGALVNVVSAASPIHQIDAASLGALSVAATTEPIFADMNSVDEAFGALTDAAGSVPCEAPTIPEILRVFAPAGPECVARPLAMPALAQREHHLLGVDSPLAFPITQFIGEAL
jgi:hypothetical protein